MSAIGRVPPLHWTFSLQLLFYESYKFIQLVTSNHKRLITQKPPRKGIVVDIKILKRATTLSMKMVLVSFTPQGCLLPPNTTTRWRYFGINSSGYGASLWTVFTPNRLARGESATALPWEEFLLCVLHQPRWHPSYCINVAVVSCEQLTRLRNKNLQLHTHTLA